MTDRTTLLLGPEAVNRLAMATVVVVGMGAVGSYATEALARAGVGNLRLVDFDTIQASNLNRQLFALHSTLGRPKVEVARERVQDIQPGCHVETLPLFAHRESAAAILEGGPDLFIDAIDALNPKVAMLHAAWTLGIPTVAAMGAARRTEATAFVVGDISETYRCPLARMVRRSLKELGVAQGIRCVWSSQAPIPDSTAPPSDEPDTCIRGRRRLTIGSLSTLTGIMGLTVANEGLRLLLGGAFPTHE